MAVAEFGLQNLLSLDGGGVLGSCKCRAEGIAHRLKRMTTAARNSIRAAGAQFLMSEGVSARRSCRIMGVSTAAPYRRSAPDTDVELRERLRKTWRPNMGYRMAHALIKPEFAPLNVKRVGVRRTFVPHPLGSTVALLDNTQAQNDMFT